MKKFISLSILFIFICCFTLTAQALMIQWDLSYEYTQATSPEGPKPWVTIKVYDSIISDTTIIEVNSFLVNSEFIKSVYFNVDSDPTQSFYEINDSTAPSPLVIFSPNSYHAAGDGWFDMKLDFTRDIQNKFLGGEKFSMSIVDPNISANSFNLQSVNSLNPLFCAAHIGGIGDNDRSGWITNNILTPEPSTALLFLASFLLFPFAYYVRRHK